MNSSEPRHGAWHEEALRHCARHLGTSKAELQVRKGAPTTEHYASDIYFVSRRSEPDSPTHVIKVGLDTWDPEHEFEALKFAARALSVVPGMTPETNPATTPKTTPETTETGLGVVEAVAFGCAPNFLVTTYQQGVSLQPYLTKSIRGWPLNRPTEQARRQCRALARWVAAFRAAETRADGGLRPADYLEMNLQHVAEIRRAVATAASIERLQRTLEGYMAQLTDDDRLRMSRSYPIRGDCRPKNFLVDEGGTLYGLDMEGFGFGPMEHDLSCMRSAIEMDAVRSPLCARRAQPLWGEFWDTYMQLGNSPRFALLGYLHFLLPTIPKRVRASQASGLRTKILNTLWVRSRLSWLRALTGDLGVDAELLRRRI